MRGLGGQAATHYSHTCALWHQAHVIHNTACSARVNCALCAAIMGRIGGAVLAGVGLGSLLSGSFNWVFGFLSVLTVPKVAKAMANNDKAEAQTHIGQSLWIAVLVGCTTMALVLLQAPAIVNRAPPAFLPSSSCSSCLQPHALHIPWKAVTKMSARTLRMRMVSVLAKASVGLGGNMLSALSVAVRSWKI